MPAHKACLLAIARDVIPVLGAVVMCAVFAPLIVVGFAAGPPCVRGCRAIHIEPHTLCCDIIQANPSIQPSLVVQCRLAVEEVRVRLGPDHCQVRVTDGVVTAARRLGSSPRLRAVRHYPLVAVLGIASSPLVSYGTLRRCRSVGRRVIIGLALVRFAAPGRRQSGIVGALEPGVA